MSENISKLDMGHIMHQTQPQTHYNLQKHVYRYLVRRLQTKSLLFSEPKLKLPECFSEPGTEFIQRLVKTV